MRYFLLATLFLTAARTTSTLGVNSLLKPSHFWRYACLSTENWLKWSKSHFTIRDPRFTMRHRDTWKPHRVERERIKIKRVSNSFAFRSQAYFYSNRLCLSTLKSGPLIQLEYSDILQRLLNAMLLLIEEDKIQVIGTPKNSLCGMRHIRPLGPILFWMGAFGRC